MTEKRLWIVLLVMLQMSSVLCRSTVKPTDEEKTINKDFMFFPPIQASVAKTIEEYFAHDRGAFANESSSSNIDKGLGLFAPVQASLAITIDEYFADKAVDSNNKSASPSRIFEGIDEDRHKIKEKIKEIIQEILRKQKEEQERIANFNRNIGNIKFNIKRIESSEKVGAIGGGIVALVVACCCCCCKLCWPKKEKRRQKGIVIPNKEGQIAGTYQPPAPGTVPPMQQHPLPHGWAQQQNAYPDFHVHPMQQHPPSYEQAQQRNTYPVVHAHAYNQHM